MLTTLAGLFVSNSNQEIRIEINPIEPGWKVKGNKVQVYTLLVLQHQFVPRRPKVELYSQTLVEKRGDTNSLFPRYPLRLNIAEYGTRSPIAKALPWHILS